MAENGTSDGQLSPDAHEVGTDRHYRTLVDAVEDGLYRLDRWGNFVAVNDALTALSGYAREELLGRHVSQVLDEADVARAERTIRGLPGSDGETATIRLRVRTATGDAVPCELGIGPVVEDGEFRGTVGVIQEVSAGGDRPSSGDRPGSVDADRGRADRTLAGSERQFRSLVDAVEEYAIFMLDVDGRVVTWNEGARRIKGYEATEIRCEHFSTFYTEADREAGVPERNLAIAAEEGSVEDEGWRVRKDGSRFWATVTITAVRDDDGTLQGYAKVTRDMTDRREREQRLREEKAFVESLFDAQPDLVYALDPEGRPLRWNDRLPEVTGYDDDEIADMSAGEFVADDAADRAAEAIETVVDGGKQITVELPVETVDGERIPYQFSAAPLVDDGEVVGLTGVGRDVSQLRAQARRLQRQRDELAAELDEVYRRIDDAVFALDDEWRFTHINDRAEEYLERSEGELLGAGIWEAFPAVVDSTFEAEYRRAMETQDPASFEAYYEPLETWFEVRAYPSASGLSVYFRDVTDRVERERELQQYETIIETMNDGVYVVDGDGEFVLVNDAYVELTGYGREQLLGSHVSLVVDEETVASARQLERDLRADPSESVSIEAEVRTADGDRVPAEATFALLQRDDAEPWRIGVVRDVTERKERERELEQYETLARTASDVIVRIDDDSVVRDVNPAVADVFGYDPGELIGEPLTTLMPERLAGAHGTAMQESLGADERTLDWEYVELPGVRGDGTEIPLAVSFSEYEQDGQRYFTGIIRDISERKERERELDRQRQRLAALNHLNDIVRDVTDAVIDQSTREEIERTVCEAFAESPSYEFAWIGEVDTQTRTVQLRTEAGVSGYLDGVTISVDPDDERSDGPTGRAIRTGEVQTTRDVQTDARHDPWREHVEEYDFRSSAAIPIVHEGTQYGVLNVYAKRPAAFAGEERTVLDQFGEFVGHAIAAAERKQALMSDEVVELDFRIENVFAELDLPVSADDRITIDRAVPADGDDYLVYGTASGDGMATLEAIVEAVPYWESIRVVGDDGDRPTYEARLNEPPVLTMLASRGGYVAQAHIEDGDYRMRIQLPPSVAVREVVDAVQETYPAAEVRAQRQITRTDDGWRRVAAAFQEELTDRQRAVLESAYFSGYFEWPRESSGEEVAESLSISPATFSQHLRRAEGRIFAALFEDGD